MTFARQLEITVMASSRVPCFDPTLSMGCTRSMVDRTLKIGIREPWKLPLCAQWARSFLNRVARLKPRLVPQLGRCLFRLLVFTMGLACCREPCLSILSPILHQTKYGFGYR